MADLVEYDARNGVADVVMDDGQVNKMSPEMLRALHGACDRAEAEGSVLMLSGRPGIFSAGFDMKVFPRGRDASVEMLRLGAGLVRRLLALPVPVVTVCTGHAYPMGAFLMLAADRRIGSSGDFRIGLNETAIRMTLPWFAVEIARHRLSPAYFHRVTTGDLYGPEEAVRAGFLDEVVAPELARERGFEVANGLREIDFPSHAATKLRVRRSALEAIDAAIDAELSG